MCVCVKERLSVLTVYWLLRRIHGRARIAHAVACCVPAAAAVSSLTTFCFVLDRLDGLWKEMMVPPCLCPDCDVVG